MENYLAFPSSGERRGVIIYAKSDFNVSPNSHLNSLYNDASWCDWRVDDETVLVGTIYRSPSSEDPCVVTYKLINESC